MTEDKTDLSTDWLADASMSVEQRQIWDSVREELAQARLIIHELEMTVKTLRRQIEDEQEKNAILSRPEFNREVARMLAFDERYGGISSVLYIDIENMGELTKSYGSEFGRLLAQKACDALSKQIRASDIFGRLGTNEFGVFLARCDNENAWKKGEALTAKLRDELQEVGGKKIEPLIHFGAYTFSEHENPSGGLKQAADSMTQST
jgi:diguanylate cyclase (GGDEF)-like protein